MAAPKTKTKDLAKQIALMFVEIETYEKVIEEAACGSVLWPTGPSLSAYSVQSREIENNIAWRSQRYYKIWCDSQI